MNSIVNESTTQRQGGEGGPTNPASPSDVVAALRRHEWVRIMQEAADLIEQQAARIKELEAERVVSGAMCVIEGRCLSGEQHQRIKELEAEIGEYVGHLARVWSWGRMRRSA